MWAHCDSRVQAFDAVDVAHLSLFGVGHQLLEYLKISKIASTCIYNQSDSVKLIKLRCIAVSAR